MKKIKKLLNYNKNNNHYNKKFNRKRKNKV